MFPTRLLESHRDAPFLPVPCSSQLALCLTVFLSLSQSHAIPLLVDPTGQALASIKALRKGIYWYQYSTASSNLAHEVFQVIHDGGFVLLRLSCDPGEVDRLEPMLSALRANPRTGGLITRFPRPLIAYTDSLAPSIPRQVAEAFAVINCMPFQGDVTNRVLSEIMRLKDPAREER